MSRVDAIRRQISLPLLLTDEVSVRYASGFAFTDGAVLIGPERAWLITDSRYAEAAAQAVTDMEILVTGAGRTLTSILKNLAAENRFTELLAEGDRVSHDGWEKMEHALGVTLVPAGGLLTELRACKDEAEVNAILAAQAIAEQALDAVLGLLRPGMTEQEAAAELVYHMYKYGSEANAFDPIVVSGPRTSMPHGVPSDRVIQTGDFVTMDFGAVYNGYCSDMTRTVAVGDATEEMRRVYDTVLEAQLAGIAAAKPGATGRAIDAAARDVIATAGYGEYFGHSFGHSLGLEIHESPNASPSNNTPMPVGAVISAEPGIYIPGKFGVRIEDMLWLRDGGARNLTTAAKELTIL
ncbi:MAG: aminopeptidase P family protein [Oscillospiraceae bacterium]|nr:aminopeptidase P family protein [Oscillospiraceae bacterium]